MVFDLCWFIDSSDSEVVSGKSLQNVFMSCPKILSDVSGDQTVEDPQQETEAAPEQQDAVPLQKTDD